MTRYKYEFEFMDFEKGDCCSCALSYQSYNDQYEEWNDLCVLGCNYEDCPLVEVSEVAE